MMDELNKGIRTYRVLNKNALPSNFDSLIQTSASDGSTNAKVLSVAAIEDIALVDLPQTVAEVMHAGGINGLRYVSTALGECKEKGGIAEAIASRGNAVVAGNIFMSPDANGCGYGLKWEKGDGDDKGKFDWTSFSKNAPKIAMWTGGYERVMGEAGAQFDTDPTDAPILMTVGLGPSSTLFNANELGGLTSVPVYRHVSGSEYNRFVALFNVGTAEVTVDNTDPKNPVASITGVKAGDQVWLTAIVDGAGDTKEEELGEWDGTRNTI